MNEVAEGLSDLGAQPKQRTEQASMRAHVVADTLTDLANVRCALEPKYEVTSELLGGANARYDEYRALVVKVDLRLVENIILLRKVLGRLRNVRNRIFLLDEAVHLHISQAYALGATLVLTGPVNRTKLLAVIATDFAPHVPSIADDSDGERAAATIGETAIASMFAAVANVRFESLTATDTTSGRGQKRYPFLENGRPRPADPRRRQNYVATERARGSRTQLPGKSSDRYATS